MSYLLFIRQQWEIFKGSYWILVILILLILILGLKNFNAIRFGMFASGFASISSELTIIYLFQMVFGNAYQYTGIVFSVFMSGLVIGPLLSRFNLKTRQIVMYKYSIALLGLLSLLMPFLINLLIDLDAHRILLYTVFFSFTFLISCISGNIFRQATLFQFGDSINLSGKIYSSDLFGSALGALLLSIFIIPLIGLLWSGLGACLLCIIPVILIRK